MATESLIVELDARTAKLDAKLKATQNQLDALDGKVKDTDDSFISLSKAGEVAGRGITALAAAGAAAGAALGAATAVAVQYSKELQIASNRTGDNVEKLQSMAFATKTVGVDLEKLGDIGKDTREKIGEFVATGGGGFDNFVKVMGLTKIEAAQMAAEFSNLSGTDVLQAMVERMDAAGVSTQEMSFALEGMASDTTDLIPLLVDNGKELKRLEQDYKDLGITLTDVDLERIDKLGEKTAALAEVAKSSTSKVVSVLHNEIADITDLLATSSKDIGGLVVTAVTGFQHIVVKGASLMSNFAREQQIQALQIKSAIVGIFGDNSEIEAEIKKLRDSDAVRDAFDLKYIENQWQDATNKIKEYYGEIDKNETKAPKITTPEKAENTPEQLKTSGTGTSEQIEKIKDRFKTEKELLKEKLQQDLAAIGEYNKTAEQLKSEHQEKLKSLNTDDQVNFEAEKTALDEKLQSDLSKLSDHNELKKQLQQEYQNAINNMALTDEEKIAERFKSEEELLNAKLANELIIIGENEVLKQSLIKEHEDAISKIKQDAINKQKAAKDRAKNDADKVTAADLKEQKKVEQQKLSNARQGIQAAMILNNAFFEDNKAIAAGLIVADTAAAIMSSLKANPYDYANVALIAATGLANLSQAQNAQKGGGGGSASSGLGGGTSNNIAQPQQQEQETSSLQLTDLSDTGSQRIIVEFATDSGDQLMDSIASNLNQRGLAGI